MGTLNFYLKIQSLFEWYIFQLYHGKNMIIFNEMMMSALFLTNTLSWIFIVLAHWNNNLRLDMLLHSDTLFWFRANPSLLFLLNAACLAEKQQIPILVFGLTWPGFEPTILTALEASTRIITPRLYIVLIIPQWWMLMPSTDTLWWIPPHDNRFTSS